MSNWFARNFGNPGNAVADIRHELMGGWFGRNFEPHPTRQQSHDTTHHAPDRNETGRDIHGNEHGIDR